MPRTCRDSNRTKLKKLLEDQRLEHLALSPRMKKSLTGIALMRESAERYHEALRDFDATISQTILIIKSDHIPALSDEEIWTIYGVFLYAAVMPHFLTSQGRKRRQLWVDVVIYAFRALFERHGISTSLSYTDPAQSKIDTAFARLLVTVWDRSPIGARSASSDALVHRARHLRALRPKLGRDGFLVELNASVESILNEVLPLGGIVTLFGSKYRFGTFPPRGPYQANHGLLRALDENARTWTEVYERSKSSGKASSSTRGGQAHRS